MTKPEGDGHLPPSPKIKRHPAWLRLTLVLVIVTIGFAGMKGLASLRKTPPVTEDEPLVLHAEAMVVELEDVPTVIRGYGTARPHRIGEVSAEVSGRVLELHPRLNRGVVVEEGTVLLRIDPRDIELSLESARAEVLRLETELERLEQEESNDRRRLEVARELRDISKREYERTRNLVEQDGVETVSALDMRLQEVTSRENAIVEIENSLALVEPRRAHVRAQLRAAETRLEQHKLDLDRTTVRAPFPGRIESKHVDLGQRVSPGQTLVVLADDSTLEIPASIDSREVARWLDLKSDPVTTHWFESFNETPVRVRWTEGDPNIWFHGVLARVERYDPATRTFHLVASVSARQGIQDGPEFFPLTNGMFCLLEIPGRKAPQVARIPRSAIDSNSQVLLDNGGRVETRRVSISRLEEEIALVGEGLETGDRVLLNRPPRVLDGMLVESTLVGEVLEKVGNQ